MEKTLFVLLYLTICAAIWLLIGGIAYWIYDMCLVPLGAPQLGFWQLIGIWVLLGLISNTVFKKR